VEAELTTPVGDFGGIMRRMQRWMAMVLVGGLAAVSAVAAPEGSTVITSKTLQFDYGRFIAVFEGDVVVEDPQIRMEADRMNIVFEGSNTIKSVTASGNVRIWQDDKIATCQRALYVAKSGEIILRGDATLKRGEDSVAGEEITFWMNEERMTCTPGRLIISSKGQSGGAADILPSRRSTQPPSASMSNGGKAPPAAAKPGRLKPSEQAPAGTRAP